MYPSGTKGTVYKHMLEESVKEYLVDHKWLENNMLFRGVTFGIGVEERSAFSLLASTTYPNPKPKKIMSQIND